MRRGVKRKRLPSVRLARASASLPNPRKVPKMAGRVSGTIRGNAAGGPPGTCRQTLRPRRSRLVLPEGVSSPFLLWDPNTVGGMSPFSSGDPIQRGVATRRRRVANFSSDAAS